MEPYPVFRCSLLSLIAPPFFLGFLNLTLIEADVADRLSPGESISPYLSFPSNLDAFDFASIDCSWESWQFSMFIEC